MVYYFPNEYGNTTTPRYYLKQWFSDDILVITDGEVNHSKFDVILDDWMSNRSNVRPVLDLTHNPVTLDHVPVRLDPTLTGDFTFFYRPTQGMIFFPLFLWMFSLRSNLWWPSLVFDAGNQKTHGAMCFNNTSIWHRTELYNMLEPVRSKIVYSFGNLRIESPDLSAMIGVQSPVYSQCAVNIITETRIDVPFCGEKTAKPFIARQIPVIVGAKGVNQFLTDVGLDMFPDLVPWQQWDLIADDKLRLEKIGQFLLSWIDRENLVDIYHGVKSRVERNKQYFHSEQFRQILMRQIDHLSILD